MPEVRKAVRADVPALADALAQAFFEDPVASYLFPDDEWRRRSLPRFFRVQLRHGYLRRGEVYTTADRRGTAMWLPPWPLPPTVVDRIAHFAIAPLVRGRIRAARELTELLAAHHPHRPHYYLGTLGVHPSRQGRGYATGLMAPFLARCDGDGIGAYLECSHVANVAFYARSGFVVTETVNAPYGGPPLWLMWREPPTLAARSGGSV